MATAAGETTSLTLAALAAPGAGVTLQRGDHDARHTWGGKARSGISGQPVHELQQALLAIGAMNATPDGDFGRKTTDAVRRLQWYLNTIPVRLRMAAGSDEVHGSLEAFAAPAGIQVDGFVRQTTLNELLAWQQGGFVLTSPLVRKSTTTLSNIELAPTFTVLAYPSAGANEFLVHQGFVATVASLNTQAAAASVSLRINQSFRVQGLPPTGAVVPPATNSQHLIGHALDLNIVDGSTVNTSAMFIAGTQSKSAKDFIKGVKQDGIRWGGDFSPKDPPHFDDFVLPSSEDFAFSFYFAQRSFSAQHPIRTA